MPEFTIGCDPEIFLRRNGKAFSAHGVIPGTKSAPHPVDRGAVQVDGMAVEFNTDPVPLKSSWEGGKHNLFVNGVDHVMKQMKEMVKGYDRNLTFNIDSVQEFGEDVFKAAPPEAVELGCDPDYCCYTGEVNPKPDGAAVNFRTASGHIHIGWGADIPVNHPDHMEVCCSFIPYMDMTVGMFMTIIDSDPRRRELYGKAGAFRPKSYGVEYRTPSNLWLSTAQRRRTIFELTRAATVAATNQTTCQGLTGVSDQEEVRRIINTGDYEKAYDALKFLRRGMYWGDFDLKSIVDAEMDKRLAREGLPVLKDIKIDGTYGFTTTSKNYTVKASAAQIWEAANVQNAQNVWNAGWEAVRVEGEPVDGN